MAKEDQSRVFVNDNSYFINGTFDDEMRSAVVWQMDKHINKLKDTKNATLTFHISSHGGDGYLVFDLVDMFERAKRQGITIRTIVTTHAYSAGSILAVAGSDGERYISENAEHLVHYGQFDGYRKTTPLQIERNAAHYKRWTGKIVAHYEKYTTMPDIAEKIKDDDFYVTAKQALRWKLADKLTNEL